MSAEEDKFDNSDFDKLFDPEMVHEFRLQFNQIQLDKQKEAYENNPDEKWLVDFSNALGKFGVIFYRTEEEEDLIYVQLMTHLKDKNSVHGIFIAEVEHYMTMGVSPEAIAAAICAGLLSPVFRFWTSVSDDDYEME